MNNKYLFVLCPPASGSTVLWRFLETSPHVSGLGKEGQFLEPVREIMRKDPWNPDYQMPWEYIKKVWTERWNTDKPFLIEKSPANVIRAFDIEKHFSPAYFVAMVRNPYALCEGVQRRYNGTLRGSAKRWIQTARAQIENIEGLERIIYFTYEEFTENTEAVKVMILDFLPGLESLKTGESFSVHSVLGDGPRGICNMNRIKIDNLSGAQIRRINGYLSDHEELLEYFGYEFMEPGFSHAFRHAERKSAAAAEKLFQWARSFSGYAYGKARSLARRVTGLFKRRRS